MPDRALPTGPQTLMPAPGTRLPDGGQDHFIVCGLGSLGQQSVVNLKKFDDDPFEVNITAIDQRPIRDWELPEIPRLLSAPLVVGDCRQEAILRAAGIEKSRAILIVTSNESVNVECAIAARRLNSTIQIILRSSRHSLNALLARQLGKFVALDATELPAMTFALAGLGDHTVSVFTIGRHRFRVVERPVAVGDPRFDQQAVGQLHRGTYRLLDLNPVVAPSQPLGWATTASSVFHRWQPHVRVQPGDRLAYLEVDLPPASPGKNPNLFNGLAHGLLGWLAQRDPKVDLQRWRQLLRNWRQSSEESLGRVVAIAGLTALVLWLTGTLLLKATVPNLVWVKAISLGAILLLGGYGDVFGGFGEPVTPGWVQLLCLMITLTSILVVLGVLGLVAERLLNSRFDFLQRRPPIPRSDHVIVVGLGRIGRKVTSLLQDLGQPLVAIDAQSHPPALFAQIPLLTGNILEGLAAANLPTARSVIAVTDDQMLNLEIALLAAEKTLRRDRSFAPVIRTRSQRFSDNLSAMMPQAQTFCPYALSAEAFAGAAFGENILGLFRLSGQTILITEYQVEAGDTLVGRQLGQIAYGYGVVPILRETRMASPAGKPATVLLPTDEQTLEAGDRLYVLSSINGLRRIERGERTPPRRWRLAADAPPAAEATADVGELLAKLTDCPLRVAQTFLAQLPGAMEIDLYDYQAARLLQTLQSRLPLRLQPEGQRRG